MNNFYEKTLLSTENFWAQVSLPDLNGTGDELDATVPIGTAQGYYRVVLDPQ